MNLFVLSVAERYSSALMARVSVSFVFVPTDAYRERKCADTIGTVLVPRAGHFQC